MEILDQLSIFDFGLEDTSSSNHSAPVVLEKPTEEVITPHITQTPILDPLFKVGDKVKVKGKDTYPIKTVEDRWAVSVYGGSDGVITEVHGEGTAHISYLVDFPDKRECYFNEDEIIPI